jgi:hypothetical protein
MKKFDCNIMNNIEIIRKKLIYDQDPPLGSDILDLDGDNMLTIRDLWLWKKKQKFSINSVITGGNDIDHAILNMAASRWESIIREKTTSNEYDLTINIRFDSSLPSNVLGQAGVSRYSIVNSKHIPYEGIMILSTSNWDKQKLTLKSNGISHAYYTVLHEMGHILGIGTMWGQNMLLDGGGNYTGVNALREYRKVVGENVPYIPIENDGGSGTAGYHPEEGLEPGVSLNDRVSYGDGHTHQLPGLDRELMTGWAEIDADPEPLSAISVGMLQDIGYVVDYSLADDYKLFNVDGTNHQNATDGMVTTGETLYLTFVENDKSYSTQVSGYDYGNRISFSLYVSNEKRYIKPDVVTLRIEGGNAKLSKMTVTYVGMNIPVHIIPYGVSNMIGDVSSSFALNTTSLVSRLTLIFIG